MALLRWAIIALIVALIAAAFGWMNIAAGAAAIAKVLFGIFLVLAIVLFILVALGIGATRRL